jgi:hypothetical protein
MLNAKSCLNLSVSLLLLSSIVSASQAQAQSVNIPMNGNIPGTCTFGSVSGGTLAKHPQFSAVAATGGGIPAAGASVGTAGRVTVTCQSSSAITIAPPVGTGPIGFAPSVVQAIVQKGTSTAIPDMASANTGGTYEPGGPWNITNPSMSLTPGSTILNVSMVAGSGPNSPPAPPLPTGNYSYTINLSITGN